MYLKTEMYSNIRKKSGTLVSGAKNPPTNIKGMIKIGTSDKATYASENAVDNKSP